jgi:Ca2+-binding RTX toxin-like protein
LGANQENLVLTGATAINGTGNTLNNTLTGNSANNVLNGRAGDDTLTGGLGKDFFVFNAALNASTNIDTLTDYSAAADTIRLENAIFTSLTTTGALNAANFVVGTSAADANDFLIYDNSTGALYYDADANGAGATVQFATVFSSGTTPASLSAAEFVVI